MIDELEALYRNRLAELTRAASAIAGDPELGRDAVQDAFAKAVRKRRRFRGDGTLEAWVWRIVVNSARDARRRRRPSLELVDSPYVDRSTADRLPLELLTERQWDRGGRGLPRRRQGRRGPGLRWLRVRDNVYDSGSTPLPDRAVQLAAEDAKGRQVARLPR